MQPSLTPAVAVYFRELREGRGFTQDILARRVGIGKRTIERLERNEGPISIAPFERTIVELGGSPDHVNYLVTHPSATEDEAKELAQAVLRGDPAQRWVTARSPLADRDSSLVGVQTYMRVLREQQGIMRK